MSHTSLVRVPADTGDSLSAELTVLGGVAYVTVIPTDSSGAVVPGGITAQTDQAFRRLEQKLQSVGSSLSHLAHLTIYLRDLSQTRAPFNEVYSRWIPRGMAPIRCAVGVAELARPDMLVELTAIAEVPSAHQPATPNAA